MAKGLGLGGLSCGMQTMKYFLFGVNLLFTLVGLGLLVVSGIVINELGDYKEAFDGAIGYAQAVPIVGIVLGLFIFIGASLGCLGAIKENTCFVKTFLAFLILTIVVELAIAAVVIVYNNDSTLQAKLDGYMKTPFDECVGVKPELRECGWAVELQKTFKCCGYGDDDLQVKYSSRCYGSTPEEVFAAGRAATQYCNAAIVADLNSQLTTVAGVLGGVVAVSIVLVIGTCCLICGINGDNKYA